MIPGTQENGVNVNRTQNFGISCPEMIVWTPYNLASCIFTGIRPNFHWNVAYNMQLYDCSTIDPYCTEVATAVGNPGIVCSYEKSGLLVCQSKLGGPIQETVLGSLRGHVLYMEPYPVLTINSGERLLHDTLRVRAYFSLMANDEYTPGADCLFANPKGWVRGIKEQYVCFQPLICSNLCLLTHWVRYQGQSL